MAGSWRMPQEKGFLYEVWLKQNDSTLIGRSFSVQGNDTIPEESTRLAFHSSGRITFTANVAVQNGGQPVHFVLRSIDKMSFAFENRNHDFPQMIRYKPGRYTLLAAISGNTPKGYRTIRFRYARVTD